jgi:hypothetical protein
MILLADAARPACELEDPCSGTIAVAHLLTAKGVAWEGVCSLRYLARLLAAWCQEIPRGSGFVRYQDCDVAEMNRDEAVRLKAGYHWECEGEVHWDQLRI